MKTLLFLCSLLTVVSLAFGQDGKQGAIRINDPQLNDILAKDTKLEILAGGHEWTEGPLWLPGENKLIYSDLPKNAIFEWSEEGGKKLYLEPSGYTGILERGGEPGSNGLVLNPEGKLTLCQHGDRQIALMDAPVTDPKAEFKTLVKTYNGKKLNSPNDAAYHKNGDLYFTDPPYGLEQGEKDPAKELDFQGVYMLDKKGKLTLLTRELSRPNGIAFSPDYKKLYVANSDHRKALWMVYDVDENGLLKNGRVFFNATEKIGKFRGVPDGLKVHPEGWVFATGPGGVLIFDPDGTHLGTIITGQATSNCAFKEDYSELYITANDYLMRIGLKK